MKVISHGLLGRETTEAIAIPLGALAASLLVFGAFVAAQGVNPLSVYQDMVRGAFGTWFSLQNTLLRAAPLMLTALCTALPARLGLIVIGGEGALAMGGLSAASAALAARAWGAPPAAVLAAMLVSGLAAGALWIGLAGALRVYRGVSETISSLLLNYIGIAILNHLVEGALRDPASLNKPSTASIGAENALGSLPGLEVHWGLAYGVLACALCYVLMHRTTFGFGAAMSGGNVRAALLAGLPVKRLVVLTCTLAGACAGLAGMVEVAAVHGRANASLISGYGYTGILVAFIARHNPLAIMPVALLLGGIGASGGLLQRTARLPDATVSVLQGILFIAILASETLYGRSLSAREPKVRQAAPAPSVA
ncbi:ABC transporter permease [Sorangium sp. So ce128]|uniref:ABC transporter permease n=1 Tax=Sorangium sp. So ce128 TaxID=3133281 RepID=UPI003F616761